MAETKGRDRSHLRLVTGHEAPALQTSDTSANQPDSSYQAWDPNHKPPSSNLVELVRGLIKDSIVRVNTSKSTEERFKFVCTSGKFEWIIITRTSAERITVRSNDEQMDIGKPPTFYRTGKREQAHDFVIDVMTHLCRFIGNFQNIKIVHELEPIA